MRSVGRNTLEVNNTDKNYTAHCSKFLKIICFLFHMRLNKEL